jgi:LacI family transcriptional regulator
MGPASAGPHHRAVIFTPELVVRQSTAGASAG